jgi:hypothetical protein
MRLIHVSEFKPANELDGPYQEAAVALRFPYDARGTKRDEAGRKVGVHPG